ncbi:DUF4337 family protein [Janthinobacterium violaceinigrum]|uniref:DUF4337 family protein n=2 Tax=Oxalobacteraceae TaxID=75682 RepID=A0A6I1I9J3_9BURK|nr:DUF4337 family protein [Janthinobacterium violaceinigrum]
MGRRPPACTADAVVSSCWRPCAASSFPPTCSCERSVMEEEYEVPSPHEHAVEEATEKERDGLTQKIALMTAILATIGALISYQSGNAQNEAMFLKNESILKQAQASDQWALYQAKSTKGHIAEATAALASVPEVRARFLAEQARQEREKALVQAQARQLEEQSRKLGEESEAKLRPHERLAMALTFIQIAVALAAITVLTRRRWLLWGSVGAAAAGILAAGSAFLL